MGSLQKSPRRRPGSGRRSRAREWLASHDAPWGSALIGAAILIAVTGFLVIDSVPREGRLNTDPTIRLVGPPQPGTCVVASESGAVLGEIVGVLGRDGELLMYRVQGFRRSRNRRGFNQDFPRDVWISAVRVVPCREVAGRERYPA